MENEKDFLDKLARCHEEYGRRIIFEDWSYIIVTLSVFFSLCLFPLWFYDFTLVVRYLYLIPQVIGALATCIICLKFRLNPVYFLLYGVSESLSDILYFCNVCFFISCDLIKKRITIKEAIEIFSSI